MYSVKRNNSIEYNLSLIGYSSIGKYYSSDLFRMIREVVLQRDKFKCQFKTCHNTSETLFFLHNDLPAYLGIGCFNLFSVCSDCASLELRYGDKLFVVSGMRAKVGRNRPEIGQWYQQRFNDNQKVARAIYKRLNTRLQNFVLIFLRQKAIGESYWEYLGLSSPTS